jgi:hypothetical protein
MNSFECLSCMYYIDTRKHHKEDNSSLGSIFRKSSFMGRNPKDSSVMGRNIEREVTFSIDVKGGEIYQMHDRELDSWRESTEAWFQGK